LRVLFICSGNAHRSPLAEALLKKLRPDLEAESAGIHTAIPISEEARNFLTKENAEQYLKKAPENLDSKELSKFNLIIAMEQSHKQALLNKCPECESRLVVWNIQDPYFLPPEHAEKIYEQIKAKVTELAELL
jgi:protein-tyrosine-phosphatase